MERLKFSQFEVEKAISDILQYGDKEAIANFIGKSASLISQMYNPDEERVSDIFKAAEQIAGELEINQERGLKLLRLFNSFAERHVKEKKAECPDAVIKCLLTEWSQFLEAELFGKPLETQISELDDVIAKATELKKSKPEEAKREIRKLLEVT